MIESAAILTLVGFAGLTAIVGSVVFGFGPGIWFSVAMVGRAGAALELFASVALIFWYNLRLLMSRDGRSRTCRHPARGGAMLRAV